MQRSRVNMTIAQLTASLSTHQPRNTSPKDHTGGSSPFVETTAPLTTVELEGNGIGDMAHGLNCCPPKGPDQQYPPPSNLTLRPAPANNPFPCLKIKCSLPPPRDQQLVYKVLFRIIWKQMAMAHESNQSKMPLRCSPYGNG